MSLRIDHHALQQIPKFQGGNNRWLPYSSLRTQELINASPPRLQISISCTGRRNNNSSSDAELAIKLAREVEKFNSQTAEREEALNKSREVLFDELSRYMGSEVDEAKKKWMRMREDDKLVVVKGFVSGWSRSFHPLSARSVKELVDEYLVDEKQPLIDSATMLFPSLRKLILGFSENNSSC